MSTFPAWIARKDEDNRIRTTLEEAETSFLDDLDVTVQVHYSSINYKDALALHGKPGVIRRTPLIVGIDLAGEVIASRDQRWHPGDLVTLDGAGLGEELHGGLAGLARVGGDDLVVIPDAFTPAQSAAIGTAGFTAALSILALERQGVNPNDGPVLVTGAGGGVGTVAIAMLAQAGYEVIAATGRPDALCERLTELGATSIINRGELNTDRPLARQQWAGVVDSVGGPTLAGALAGLHNNGAAAACGLAGGSDLPTTVLPFILRGVNLLGVDSVRTKPGLRRDAWERLARDLNPEHLDSVTRTVLLKDAADAGKDLLDGHGTGRTVVQISE